MAAKLLIQSQNEETQKRAVFNSTSKESLLKSPICYQPMCLCELSINSSVLSSFVVVKLTNESNVSHYISLKKLMFPISYSLACSQQSSNRGHVLFLNVTELTW